MSEGKESKPGGLSPDLEWPRFETAIVSGRGLEALLGLKEYAADE